MAGGRLEGYLLLAGGIKEASTIRRPDVVDLAERRLFVKPEDLKLARGPTRRVAAAFNPAIEVEGSRVRVHARIEVGYYTYASMIGGFTLDAGEILSGSLRRGEITVEPEIMPGDWVDFWGAEDPRYSEVDGEKLLVYTGRTLTYFAGEKAPGRTYPVVASPRRGGWVKLGYITLPGGKDHMVISSKNAFLVKEGGEVYAFHRVHDVTGRFHLLVSRVSWPPGGGLSRIEARESWVVLEPQPFEDKIGWSTLVHGLKGERGYLALIHAVDATTPRYLLFAALIRLSSGKPEVEAVTPTYIMAPREPEEVYGDRPYTIYPCGAWAIDDQIIISYGAGDMAIGFASIKIDYLMSELDKGSLKLA